MSIELIISCKACGHIYQASLKDNLKCDCLESEEFNLGVAVFGSDLDSLRADDPSFNNKVWRLINDQ